MTLKLWHIFIAGMLLAASGAASAGGVTAYLPMNLEPEIERQVERVLILADEPILKRPFSVELVKLALPQACQVDKPLCTKVGKYLERYSRDYAVSHASATATVAHAKDGTVLPDQHGMPADSDYELSVVAYVQPTDYFLVSAGGIAYSGRAVPTGSMASVGTNWAQLDFGYRDHWFSPMTDSSSIMSTEAPTMPSVTLSNYEPLTRLGFQYEFFLARMSSTEIAYNGEQQIGRPRLFGAQFSIEPFSGWSLGVNRLLQYGGGAGLPSSFHFLARDFLEPSGASQTQGNQQASYVSRFIVPSKVPFAVYFQYAGEDNSDGGSYLLGSPSISAGIDFPRIFRHFDATYEISEWSNIWYVHSIFLNGMTNDHFVLGSWGADQRNFGDGVGARSQMLRVGWEPPFGGYLEARARTLQNQTYYGGDNRTYVPTPGAFPYYHYYDFTLRYSTPGMASWSAPKPWAAGTSMATAFPDFPASFATAAMNIAATRATPTMRNLPRPIRITTARKSSSMRASMPTRCAPTWIKEYRSRHLSWPMGRTSASARGAPCRKAMIWGCAWKSTRSTVTRSWDCGPSTIATDLTAPLRSMCSAAWRATTSKRRRPRCMPVWAANGGMSCRAGI